MTVELERLGRRLQPKLEAVLPTRSHDLQCLQVHSSQATPNVERRGEGQHVEGRCARGLKQVYQTYVLRFLGLASSREIAEATTLQLLSLMVMHLGLQSVQMYWLPYGSP